MNPDLQSFVRDALARGATRDDVRRVLQQAGWPAEEIDAALAAWSDVPFVVPVPRRRPYLSAREAFLYLVLFVTLYTTAFNVGVLLFEAIERWVPDPVRRGFAEHHSPERVRGGVAGVLIAFPIYLFLSRLIGRSLGQDPEKRASRIRKWLTYLTLFVAAVVIIGDLTYLVTRLLGGELPPRFLLKTLVVFAIAGVAFGHFLADLRREEGAAPAARAGRATPLARGAAVAIFATLGMGLWMAGSPGAERHRRLDQQRADDLSVLASRIQGYYDENRALPDSLALLSQIRGGPLPVVNDPVTGAPYEYRILDSLRYEVCAVFDLPDSAGARPYDDPSRLTIFQKHRAGRDCFELKAARTFPLPIPR